MILFTHCSPKWGKLLCIRQPALGRSLVILNWIIIFSSIHQSFCRYQFRFSDQRIEQSELLFHVARAVFRLQVIENCRDMNHMHLGIEWRYGADWLSKQERVEPGRSQLTEPAARAALVYLSIIPSVRRSRPFCWQLELIQVKTVRNWEDVTAKTGGSCLTDTARNTRGDTAGVEHWGCGGHPALPIKTCINRPLLYQRTMV